MIACTMLLTCIRSLVKPARWAKACNSVHVGIEVGQRYASYNYVIADRHKTVSMDRFRFPAVHKCNVRSQLTKVRILECRCLRSDRLGRPRTSGMRHGRSTKYGGLSTRNVEVCARGGGWWMTVRWYNRTLEYASCSSNWMCSLRGIYPHLVGARGNSSMSWTAAFDDLRTPRHDANFSIPRSDCLLAYFS